MVYYSERYLVVSMIRRDTHTDTHTHTHTHTYLVRYRGRYPTAVRPGQLGCKNSHLTQWLLSWAVRLPCKGPSRRAAASARGGENGRGQAEITSGETRGPSPVPHGHELTWPVSSPHGWVPSVSFLFFGRPCGQPEPGSPATVTPVGYGQLCGSGTLRAAAAAGHSRAADPLQPLCTALPGPGLGGDEAWALLRRP